MPTSVSPWNTLNVGMDLMPHALAMSALLSTSTLMKVTSSNFVLISPKRGAAVRQGGHHVAKKSAQILVPFACNSLNSDIVVTATTRPPVSGNGCRPLKKFQAMYARRNHTPGLEASHMTASVAFVWTSSIVVPEEKRYSPLLRLPMDGALPELPSDLKLKVALFAIREDTSSAARLAQCCREWTTCLRDHRDLVCEKLLEVTDNELWRLITAPSNMAATFGRGDHSWRAPRWSTRWLRYSEELGKLRSMGLRDMYHQVSVPLKHVVLVQLLDQLWDPQNSMSFDRMQALIADHYLRAGAAFPPVEDPIDDVESISMNLLVRLAECPKLPATRAVATFLYSMTRVLDLELAYLTLLTKLRHLVPSDTMQMLEEEFAQTFIPVVNNC